MAIILQDPFEVSEMAESGWSFSAITQYAILTADPNQWNGYGGTRYLRGKAGSSFGSVRSHDFGNRKHVRVRAAAYLLESVTDLRLVLYPATVTGSALSQLLIQGGGGNVWKAFRGGNEIASSSSSGTLQTWAFLEMEVYSHVSNGRFKVWLDGVLIIDFTGNTGGSSSARLGLTGSNQPCWDDVVVQDISMSYDTGVGGAPVAGETITDAVSGATAIITEVIGNATSGRLILEAWDDVDFADGNQVTSTGTFDAQVSAPNATYKSGLEPNSTYIGPGYIMGIPANANGTKSEMTGSDGDSIDNYLLTNGVATDTDPATYAHALVGDKTDTYKADVSARIPSGAAIRNVAVAARAASSLSGVDGISGVLRIGGTEYLSARKVLPSGFDWRFSQYAVDPSVVDTLDQTWDAGKLTDVAFEYGNKLVT
tara:strand:- start:945 stop:2222 length:1278 start_codon:yes stop_codon:yes gene_type:complete